VSQKQDPLVKAMNTIVRTLSPLSVPDRARALQLAQQLVKQLPSDHIGKAAKPRQPKPLDPANSTAGNLPLSHIAR
jgi:hypothetical protein